MDREKVVNLDHLLKNAIGDKKIIDTKISRLTAPGDNYGGLLLKVDLTLEDSKGAKEELHVVTKSIPVNQFLQQVFNIQITVKKEIAIYDSIVPLLQDFQREQGVEDVMDFFPKLYGARLNLNGGDVVDENSVIVMENLVHSGYENVERGVGFDYETTKLVLKDLATFHSTTLALKISKPEVFEKEITPYLTPMVRPPPPKDETGKSPSTPHDILREYFDSWEEIQPILPKLKDVLDFNPEIRIGSGPRPIFTVTHGDLWGNNIMIKFDKGKPVATKIVDFQNIALRSPVTDLLFLLWSSVQATVLEGHFDDLIQLYQVYFVENLKRLNCDSSPFEDILDDIKVDTKAALMQTIFMVTFVIFGTKWEFTQDPNTPPDVGTKDDITPEARERLLLILNKCNEKGWL